MRVPSHDPRIDFEIRADSPSDAYVIREQFCENVYDLHPTDLEDTGIVFDVGANIGAFSLFAASMRDKTQVLAFEPDPANYELLQNNILINQRHLGQSRVKAIDKGLSDVALQAPLIQKHGGSHILGVDAPVATRTKAYDSLPDQRVMVGLITLHNALQLAKTEYVDVLKMDIEGYEYRVLLGPDKRLLARFRFITMEFEPSPKLGELLALLAETHNVKVTGRASQGGYLHARRY